MTVWPCCSARRGRVSGRVWLSSQSARSNQDGQRRFEERAASHMRAALARRHPHATKTRAHPGRYTLHTLIPRKYASVKLQAPNTTSNLHNVKSSSHSQNSIDKSYMIFLFFP